MIASAHSLLMCLRSSALLLFGCLIFLRCLFCLCDGVGYGLGLYGSGLRDGECACICDGLYEQGFSSAVVLVGFVGVLSDVRVLSVPRVILG